MDPTTPTPSDRPRQSDHLKEFVIAAAREGWPGYTDAELYHDPAYYKEIYSIPNMLPPKHDEVGGIQVHWHQDTFGCQVTDHIDAELGDIVVGRSKRYIQLARNKFSTRYMIMRRMEYFLEELDRVPEDPALSPYRVSTAQLFSRIELITKMPPQELPLNIASYKPTAIKITSNLMNRKDVDRSQEGQFVRALWLLIDAIGLEEYRFRQNHHDKFDMRRFIKGVNNAMRTSHFLPVLANRDGTISIVRPPLYNAVKQQLLSFLDLARFMTNCPDPFSLLRSWKQPADDVVQWWQSHLLGEPTDALWTISDRALMRVVAWVPDYLPKRHADRIINEERRKAEEAAAREADRVAALQARKAQEASWDGTRTPYDDTNDWFDKW